MKIGINLLYLLPGVVGGTETYAAGLLHGLAQIDHEDEFVVFVNRESSKWPIPQAANFSRVVCPVWAGSRSRRYIFEQLKLPQLFAKHGIDIIHSLGYVGPLSTPCISIVTIHDLNFNRLKDTMPLTKRILLQFFSKQSARRADHVITVSDFSKKEICSVIKLNPDKITVTHEGPIRNTNINLLEKWGELNDQYGIHEPYVVAFGGGALHKNISSLIRAFDLIKDEFPHCLVLIGHIPADVDLSTESIGADTGKRIITTGYVPEEDILPLLRHADLFVLPSLYEGFGLPVLEAQQAGVAVACSNAGSLPEVGGDGAFYFDAKSIESIAKAMRHCLEDKVLRSELIQKGQNNLNRFSWEKTASETLSVYQNCFQLKYKGKHHFA
jgi:glycosyltransferase involved in cell wall biosynthesis